MLPRVRTMKYKLLSFIEIDNQSIQPTIECEKTHQRETERGWMSIFSGTSKLVLSAYLKIILTRERLRVDEDHFP